MDLHLVHSLAAPPTLLAGTGIFDTLTEKITKTGDLLRAASIVAGIYFVIKNAIASGGAVPRIAISMIAAGLFIYAVFHIADLGTRTDNELKTAAAVAGLHVLPPGAPRPAWPTTPPGGLPPA